MRYSPSRCLRMSICTFSQQQDTKRGIYRMVLNAIFPHLLATIVTNTYAPGIVTGLLLNIPINTIILYKLQKRQVITKKEIAISTAVVGIVLLAMIPVLFAFGSNF